MIFHETAIPYLVVVDLERHTDERGFFARSWCSEEFRKAGLPDHFAQCNVSWNTCRHTLRGMHWQAAPHGEAKFVRCTSGALFDVAIDLRVQSPTYLQHFAIELSSTNRRAVFIPSGLAHGFLTLVDETEVLYHMDVPFVEGVSRGARWDDPAFAIEWPALPSVISDRDRTYPDFHPESSQ
jgi:dTDP-4-dehydrorhamnose 3,5-epimerase